MRLPDESLGASVGSLPGATRGGSCPAVSRRPNPLRDGTKRFSAPGSPLRGNPGPELTETQPRAQSLPRQDRALILILTTDPRDFARIG